MTTSKLDKTRGSDRPTARTYCRSCQQMVPMTQLATWREQVSDVLGVRATFVHQCCISCAGRVESKDEVSRARPSSS